MNSVAINQLLHIGGRLVLGVALGYAISLEVHNFFFTMFIREPGPNTPVALLMTLTVISSVAWLISIVVAMIAPTVKTALMRLLIALALPTVLRLLILMGWWIAILIWPHLE